MEFDIVRAWKDARYRQNLTAEQQAILPENPVGTCLLTDADLEAAQGSGFGDGGPFFSGAIGGSCVKSFGVRNDSCNTFAGFAVNCSSSELS